MNIVDKQTYNKLIQINSNTDKFQLFKNYYNEKKY